MPIDPAKPFDLTYVVYPNWIDMRLDQFVKAMVPSMSRTKIQRYIKDDRVLVNGKPRPANWRVRLDDSVVLCCNVPEDGADAGKFIPIEILYEDDDIIAINKQAGLVVHPVALHRHDTLLNALYWRYKDILPPEQDISLANRLDQYTSGVILVSKHTQSKKILQDQFEAREPKKAYMALVEGIVKEDQGEINLPIGPGMGEKDKCKMGVRHDELGKPSLTIYKVLERFKASVGQGYTLVRLEPHTGRQHQLRVHMSTLGHPMVCDDRYGNPDALIATTADQATFMIKRYALHACELNFRHPSTGQMLTVQAPLAEDIRLMADALRAGAKTSRIPSDKLDEDALAADDEPS